MEDVLATSRKTISTFIVIILAEDVAEADDEDHQRNEAGLEAHVGGLLDTKIIILSHDLKKCQMIFFILRVFLQLTIFKNVSNQMGKTLFWSNTHAC